MVKGYPSRCGKPLLNIQKEHKSQKNHTLKTPQKAPQTPKTNHESPQAQTPWIILFPRQKLHSPETHSPPNIFYSSYPLCSTLVAIPLIHETVISSYLLPWNIPPLVVSY
ncbi:hypothetical protein PGTUg99_050043 [Puccinia graminis f. sp. tritici]|uniref:Uncharacterized protein n=1 Tax=Puccinia graminis f. sp. tritici TaxID=56615 RepID=A0A5B0NCB5_PUCGR|nr:hypothetical protein PGTUg99_050043 [Puccinia graminis f. sp. tritici]